jgi:radical SAM/Cys-rich protein
MKSLKAAGVELAIPLVQIRILHETTRKLPSFKEKLAGIGLYPLLPQQLETLQVNLGKVCNQTCAHCHVDAGPDRTEVMSRETMSHCLTAIGESDIQTVDLTGGAPEMNPDFQWFVERLFKLGTKILVRSNLTILTTNAKYRRLPEFFSDHGVTVISSLPCYTAENTDSQRGTGVFDRSIEALQMLNRVGYGQERSNLELHLVYNPLGPFLPPSQEKLRSDYKRILKDQFGVVFNDLYCITNMPINRFLDQLIRDGKYGEYLETLVNGFNPTAAAGVMCRTLLSVGWDGRLYDCDFNQMLEMEIDTARPAHIREFDLAELIERRIVIDEHCFGCTAGAGSSCGGEIL